MNAGVDTSAITFQLTTSQGGRLIINKRGDNPCPFQLTTSQGGRRAALEIPYELLMNFNSRPHKEVDLAFAASSGSAGVISTHDLARRSTTSK